MKTALVLFLTMDFFKERTPIQPCAIFMNDWISSFNIFRFNFQYFPILPKLA